MDIWEVYSWYYDSLNKLIPYKNMLLEVAEEIQPLDSEFILDAGCGTGNLTELLARNSGAFIHGVDFCPPMLKMAAKKLSPKKNVTLDIANLGKKLTYKNEYFEKIALVNVLYALKDPLGTLTELHRVLKPNGKIVAVNPPYRPKNHNILKEHCRISGKRLRDSLLAVELTLVGAINKIIIKRGNSKKYHFLDENELASLFDRAGFKGISVRKTYSGEAYLITSTKE